MTTTTTTACLNCGTPLPLGLRVVGGSADDGAAQSRIDELEGEVRLLTERAATAVYKLADYEEELRKLRKSQQVQAQASLEIASPTESLRPSTAREPLEVSTPASTPKSATPSRFASLLGARRTSSSPSTVTVSTPTTTRPTSVREAELQEALQRELEARQQAETKVNQMSGELEELSAQLFQQANEMVATERKARAKLEERVEVLEKRDGDKRKRLDKLEGAVRRIERVHALLKGA